MDVVIHAITGAKVADLQCKHFVEMKRVGDVIAAVVVYLACPEEFLDDPEA